MKNIYNGNYARKEHPEAAGKSKSDVRELRKIWRRVPRHYRKGMDRLHL